MRPKISTNQMLIFETTIRLYVDVKRRQNKLRIVIHTDGHVSACLVYWHLIVPIWYALVPYQASFSSHGSVFWRDAWPVARLNEADMSPKCTKMIRLGISLPTYLSPVAHPGAQAVNKAPPANPVLG